MMTDNEIRIKIAEACGWTACGSVLGCPPHGYPPNAQKPTTQELLDGVGPAPWGIPDYLNDLNAMHKAETWLHGTPEHYHNDPKVQRRWNDYDYFLISNYGCHATARQRAEAFIKTIDPE